MTSVEQLYSGSRCASGDRARCISSCTHSARTASVLTVRERT